MLLIVVGSFSIVGSLYWHELKIFQDFNSKDFFTKACRAGNRMSSLSLWAVSLHITCS